jgi:hypothetical protein
MQWIFGMSDARADMVLRLGSNSANIIILLLLLYFFPCSPAKNHWRSETYGFIPRMTTLKGTNRFPRIDFIEQYFYLWYMDNVPGISKEFRCRVAEEGLLFPEDYGDRRFRAFDTVKAVLHEVSLCLARDHSISKDDYFSLLDFYGL